jgi:trehalose/maltose transport system substrate-binding protein
MLVRYLCSREEQARRSRNATEPPTIADLYGAPDVLANNPYFPRVLEVFREGMTFRPSGPAGKLYPDVSREYFEAVHAVLTGRKSAARAAAEVEDRLKRMLEMPVSKDTDSDDKPAPLR